MHVCCIALDNGSGHFEHHNCTRFGRAPLHGIGLQLNTRDLSWGWSAPHASERRAVPLRYMAEVSSERHSGPLLYAPLPRKPGHRRLCDGREGPTPVQPRHQHAQSCCGAPMPSPGTAWSAAHDHAILLMQPVVRPGAEHASRESEPSHRSASTAARPEPAAATAWPARWVRWLSVSVHRVCTGEWWPAGAAGRRGGEVGDWTAQLC